jgi:hypothetical protein
LEPPRPAEPEAAKDLDYVMLSQTAYGDIGANKFSKGEACIDAKKVLENDGWSMVPTSQGQIWGKKWMRSICALKSGRIARLIVW